MFRLNSQQIFLTYPQATITKTEVLDFFKSFSHGRENDNWVERLLVAEEQHQDGGIHFHVYIKLRNKINTTTERLFDIQNHHPNIQGVRSCKAVLDYCKKDGNYISLQRNGNEYTEWNQTIKRTWGELLTEATTTDEFMAAVRSDYPRDYALSYDRLLSMANANFKQEKPEYISPFTRDNFLTVRELNDWVEKNILASQG